MLDEALGDLSSSVEIVAFNDDRSDGVSPSTRRCGTRWTG